MVYAPWLQTGKMLCGTLEQTHTEISKDTLCVLFYQTCLELVIISWSLIERRLGNPALLWTIISLGLLVRKCPQFWKYQQIQPILSCDKETEKSPTLKKACSSLWQPQLLGVATLRRDLVLAHKRLPNHSEHGAAKDPSPPPDPLWKNPVRHPVSAMTICWIWTLAQLGLNGLLKSFNEALVSSTAKWK